MVYMGHAMRNPAEVLAMLTIHGVQIGHIPGGVPDLVSLDVAAALGMMHDRPGAAMLMAKYSQDAQSTRQIQAWWRMQVDRRGYIEKWTTDERQILLADYSLFEWLDAQRCRTCRGVGTQVTASGRVESCAACDGVGLRKIGLRAPARALGMSAEGYRKSAWPSRMEWARGELRRREVAALQELRGRIRN